MADTVNLIVSGYASGESLTIEVARDEKKHSNAISEFELTVSSIATDARLFAFVTDSPGWLANGKDGFVSAYYPANSADFMVDAVKRPLLELKNISIEPTDGIVLLSRDLLVNIYEDPMEMRIQAIWHLASHMAIKDTRIPQAPMLFKHGISWMTHAIVMCLSDEKIGEKERAIQKFLKYGDFEGKSLIKGNSIPPQSFDRSMAVMNEVIKMYNSDPELKISLPDTLDKISEFSGYIALASIKSLRNSKPPLEKRRKI